MARDLDATDRLVIASLANDRGFTTSIGEIDTDKVEMLETAAARLPADDSDRALILATLGQELTYGSPLERRATEALQHVRLHVALSPGDERPPLLRRLVLGGE